MVSNIKYLVIVLANVLVLTGCAKNSATTTVSSTPNTPSVGGIQQWSAINTGLSSSSSATLKIYSLAINPVTPTTIYVATEKNGIFRTTNGGAAWSLINAGIMANSIHIDPLNPAIVYAVNSGGIYKSVDGGNSWFDTSSGIVRTRPVGYLDINGFAIDPTNSMILYAALGIEFYAYGKYYNGQTSVGSAGDIFRSTDRGNSWSPMYVTQQFAISTYGSNVSYTNRITHFVIDPTTMAIYAGTEGGVYRTINGGSSWSIVNSPIGGPLTILDPLAPNIFYATTGTGLPSLNAVNVITIDPVVRTTFYAGMNGSGIYRSANSGASWISMNLGLLNPKILTLTIDPITHTTIYAGTDGGIFKWQ